MQPTFIFSDVRLGTWVYNGHAKRYRVHGGQNTQTHFSFFFARILIYSLITPLPHSWYILEKVTEAGLETDGTFLVRTRDGKPGEFVMCVVYKGKPTHHLVTPNAEGLLTVNKRTFADAKKITEVRFTRRIPNFCQ